MLIRDPVLQELNRRMVAERGVAATPVVKHFNVVEQVGDGLATRVVAHFMHPLVLKTVEETLCGCIIPAISLRTHRTDHAVGSKLRLKLMTRILAAPIGMMNKTRRWFSAKLGHRQRVGHNFRSHSWLDRPANDLRLNISSTTAKYNQPSSVQM
jgi:hypothetical protein